MFRYLSIIISELLSVLKLQANMLDTQNTNLQNARYTLYQDSSS